MSLKTLTFRMPEEKAATLDSIAAQQQRDRSFILNEAIDQYISLQEYHLSLIEAGVRDANAGHLIDHGEVMKMAASWSKKRKRA